MKKVLLCVVFLILGSLLFAQASDDVIRNAANMLGIPYEALRQFVYSYGTQIIPAGRYVCLADTAQSVTFDGNRFTFEDTDIRFYRSGSYNVSGNRITGVVTLDGNTIFEIVNQTTLRDPDGYLWVRR